ncbi:hypothetical protein LTR53_003225 [Teratosphaeriaceae sp. CCFEE 6253]|nr:hypothetical protein LTR53_003225 [Teratosphaeriaceae sp. CCFEE 6253]
MGLFVAQDGHYRGWLAALLCCIAGVGDDEHPAERVHARPTPSTEACRNNAGALTALPSLPMTRQQTNIKGDEPADHPRRILDRQIVADQPPSLRPLSLGESLLPSPKATYRPRRNSFGHSRRPSIGAPSSFRRVDHTDSQRASLVPLRLGPVVLATPMAEDPAPNASTPSQGLHAHRRSDSTQGLLSQGQRAPHAARRDTPFQRCQRPSSASLAPKTSTSSTNSSRHGNLPVSPTAEHYASRTPVSRGSSPGSLYRSARDVRASSSDRSRVPRTRSLQNMRKGSTDAGDSSADQEIVELNTIVEERRSLQARPRSPPVQHIAAIAPSMLVQARSETLNDIGSALARPLTARPASHLAHIFDSPEKPTRPSTSRASSSRVSGWLSGLLPTISTSTPAARQEPFYKCATPAPHRRPHSATSSHTSLASVTELDSPSLTAASSPTTTKGHHSRSLTAESRLTPISPPSTIYDHDLSDAKTSAEEHWPVVITQSQVGLAF